MVSHCRDRFYREPARIRNSCLRWAINLPGSRQARRVGWGQRPSGGWRRLGGIPKERRRLSIESQRCRFRPDSRLLAVGGGEPSRSGQLQVWDLEQQRLLHEVTDAHSDTVLSVRFSPDGQLLASGGTDRFVRVFQVTDWKLRNTFEGHTHHVLDLAWQPDGRRLVSGSADKTVKVWDVVKGEQIKTIEGFGLDVTAVSFVATSDQFVASSGDQSVSLCDTGGKRQVIRQLSDYIYSAEANVATGDVVVGAHDGVIVVLGIDGQPRREFR